MSIASYRCNQGSCEAEQSIEDAGKAFIRRFCEWWGVNVARKGILGVDMNGLIHIGFGNIVNTSKIIAIVTPDSAPVKRLVQKAKEQGTAIDATQGRKTKAVLVMENNQIVLSALLPETIVGRAQMSGGVVEEEGGSQE